MTDTERHLATGLFRLTKPVENPNYDARTRHDWTRAKLLEPGLYWFQQETGPDRQPWHGFRVEKITQMGRAQGYFGSATEKHPVIAAMLPYLEVEDAPNAVIILMLNGVIHSPMEILQELLDSKAISRYALGTVCQRVSDRWEEQS